MQTASQHWYLGTTAQTSPDLVFVSGVSTAAGLANLCTVAALILLPLKIYYLNYKWAIGHGLRWRFLALDILLLSFWFTHAVAFAVNWAFFDTTALRDDIKYNHMSSRYSSDTLHVTAFPSSVSEVFNTVWLALATARMIQGSFLNALTYTITSAVRQRTCQCFQLGICIYATVFTVFFCFSALILLNDALEFFGNVGATVATFVGFSMYVRYVHVG